MCQFFPFELFSVEFDIDANATKKTNRFGRESQMKIFYQFYQNLVYINHAKEYYHLMYYVYLDMLIEVHVKIWLEDISLNEAKKKTIDQFYSIWFYFDFIG